MKSLGSGWKALEENFIAVVLICSTGVLFANVVLRYFFRMSTIWAEEFIRYSIIWISFLGSAVCFRKGIHFGVDLILRVKSKAFTRAVKIFIEAACLVFCCFLIKYSFDLTVFTKGTGQISPAMRIPLWTVYAVIPFSAALGALYEVGRLFTLCAGGTPPSGLDDGGAKEIA